MNATITLFMHWSVAISLVAGGIFALRKGFELMQSGKGNAPEKNSIELLGIKATVGSIGSLVMITAFMWGWAAKLSLPSYQDQNVTITALKQEVEESKALIAKLGEEKKHIKNVTRTAKTELSALSEQIAMLSSAPSPSNDITSAPTTASSKSNMTDFGGPYIFKADPQKIINFKIYKQKRLSLSKGTRLTTDLFTRSIKSNIDFVYGERFQKYNYVIDGKGEIYVAVWTKDSINFKHADYEALCSGEEKFPPIEKKDIMINFYPEDTFDLREKERKSPCWITVPTDEGAKDVGILDALSKHFMLSQKDKRIAGFDPATWLPTTVAYAGEIIIDVKECYYILNNGSGTYQPSGNGHIEAVANHFREEIGVHLPIFRIGVTV